MPGAVFLEGETVSLRTVEEEDVPFLRDGVNHPAVRPYVGQSFPTNLEQERRFFTELNESDAIQALVVADDLPVGHVELDPVDHEQGVAELAFWLLPEHRGEGYAKEAAALMVDYAFSELRLHRVGATAFDSNEPSIRLLEKVGFTREGVERENAYVDGSYHDTVHLGILEDEWEGL